MKRIILAMTAFGLMTIGLGSAQADYGRYFSNEFVSAAYRLDQSASGFVQQVRYRFGNYSQEYRLAAEFARGAGHYRDLVARGRDLGRLREVFNELQKRFYRVERYAASLAAYRGRGHRNDGLGFYRLSVAFQEASKALRYEWSARTRGGHKRYGHYGSRRDGGYYKGGRRPIYGSEHGYRRDRHPQRLR